VCALALVAALCSRLPSCPDCPDPSTASNWCWQNFLSYRTLQQADNVRQQLSRTMERYDLDLVSTPFENKNYYTQIRQAITCG
jgi:pre-mRNA-splicing factor ATP-dependent RNA helicase DHX15/PRP43